MKQKGKQLEATTMACSKRRQKTNNIVSKKENTDDNVTIAEVSNGLVKNYIHTIISPELESVSCSENNDLIVSLEDESSEREKEELKKHKTLLNTSEMDDFTSNTCNENEDHSSKANISDDLTKEKNEVLEIGENLEKQEAEVCEEMSSISNTKNVSSRAKHLTTILENIKGEEKADSSIKTNQTKVKSDQRINDCPELKEDKNDKSETELNGRYNNMAAERVIKSPPIIIPDTDAMLIKKTKEANEPVLKENKTRRKSDNSLKSEQNVKSNLEQSQRPSSSQSDTGLSRSSTRSRTSTSKVKKPFCGIRFTKQELEYYLPKKSNFNCHEKALRDAGLDLDAVEAKRRQRFRRRTKSKIDHKEEDEKSNGVEDTKAPSESGTLPDGENDFKELEEEQSEMEHVKIDKTKRKGRKKSDEPEVKVDHTVLLQYLKYVIENQDEYLSHKRQILQQNTSLLNVDPGCTIARFGRAFQRGQHGLMDETFLLEVTRGIKSNFGDSLQWIPPVLNMKVEQTIHETTVEEKDKTEYEKMKIKLDKWLKTVTAAQLLKAKELSLKELGEEDKLQSQWWSTLQPCRYLRQRSNLVLTSPILKKS
jgi:hypothetical protein